MLSVVLRVRQTSEEGDTETTKDKDHHATRQDRRHHLRLTRQTRFARHKSSSVQHHVSTSCVGAYCDKNVRRDAYKSSSVQHQRPPMTSALDRHRRRVWTLRPRKIKGMNRGRRRSNGMAHQSSEAGTPTPTPTHTHTHTYTHTHIHKQTNKQTKPQSDLGDQEIEGRGGGKRWTSNQVIPSYQM